MREQAQMLAKALSELNRQWRPHPAQRTILQALFGRQVPVAFNECGRKFGKSEVKAYTLWRWCKQRPGEYYYFAPLQKQAKEIIWASNRIQTMGPASWIKSINNSELRINFIDGGFIKVDGSDNFQAHRGTNPHGIVLDEFKDFRPEFWHVMEPNLATHKAQALFSGTPPEVENAEFDKMCDEARRCGAYFNYPTWANPYIDREWLKQTRAKLYARGDGVIWEREYAARRVFGGPGAIFPQFSAEKHILPHDKIMAMLERDRRKLQWFVVTDPGTATVFGALFCAVNPYKKTLYILDELYLTDQRETTTSSVMPRINAKKAELGAAMDWSQHYDEAATWFAMEASQSFNSMWMPTHKSLHDKANGISLIKDQLLHRRVIMSDRCVKLRWEVERYVKDKNGNIPKVDDHLIDCWRYVNAAAGFSLMDEAEPVREDWQEPGRAFTPEQDIAELRRQRGQVDVDADDFSFPDLEYS